MTKKLVDGEFLSKLLGGSFEVIMNQVDEAVAAQPELFGGGDRSEVRTIGTFSNHAIVLNENGEFFRASFAFHEDTGGIKLGEIERVNVPMKEVSELGGEIRTESLKAAKALLSGKDNDADNHLGSLFELVQSGVKLTAEGVEDEMLLNLEEDPEWLVAVRENKDGMIKFVGSDANQEFPVPKFETFIAEGDNSDERYRKVIDSSLRKLRENLYRMRNSVAVARRIDGEYTPVVEEGVDATMVASDFVDFASEFGVDLDATIELTEDAISLASDGTLKSLARVHDGVAARMCDMGLAAAFSEKFARRFDQPQA
jgi:hypothetical protein